MADSVKDKITKDIQQAKSEGQLRSDRIRSIVKDAVSQAATELKEGSTEVRSLIRDAVSAVVDSLRDRGETLKEDVVASTEGALEAVSQARRQAIAKTQAEVNQLQAKIDVEEQNLQQEVDSILVEVEETSSNESSKIQEAIKAAIASLRDTEEAELMQRRYAQLKSQLAVLQANLAARYGERYEDVKQHLDEAKVWYEQAQIRAEASGTDPVQHKQTEINQKMGEAGTAVAQKERQVRQILKELWRTMSESFRDSTPSDSSKR